MPAWISNYWIVLIVSLVLSGGASLYVRLTYNKYSKIQTGHRVTTNQFIDWMFKHNDITDVSVGHVSGNLTDHYSNAQKIINLSDSTYGQSSIAAIGVAAHEAGHAVQYKRNYLPVHLRTLMVPVVNIGSYLGLILCIIGALFTTSASDMMINIGLTLYASTFVFTVVTLPVEFNASRRAIANVKEYQYFTYEEIAGMRRVLTAAALTYVASMVVALLNLLRIISIFGRRRD